MATRKIGTKLVFENEAQYKASVKNVNSELATLKSEMKLVDSQFKGQANSVEALTAKGDVLERQYEAQSSKLELLTERLDQAKEAEEQAAQTGAELVGSIDEKKAALEDYREKLAASEDGTISLYDENGNLIKSFEDGAAEIQNLEDELANMERALADNERQQQAATSSINDYQRQVNNAQAELNNLAGAIDDNNKYLSEARESSDGAASSIDEFGKKSDGSGSLVEGFISKAAGFFTLAGIVGLAKEIGQSILDMAMSIQEAAATIVQGTGATGEALNELKKETLDAYAQIDDTDLNNTATVLAEINTRLDLTGDKLERATVLFSDFADATGGNAYNSVVNVSKVMRNWNVDAENLEPLLDKLTKAGQASGISVDTLTGYLVENKAQLKQLGYTLDDSIALFAMMEKEGINTSQVLMGFRQAVTNFTDDGKDARVELEKVIEKIQNMGSESEATAYAVDVFGTRAGQELAYAIQEGRFELEDWITAIEDSAGAMKTTEEAADTFEDKHNNLKNSIKTDLAEVGEAWDRLTGKTVASMTEQARALEDVETSYQNTMTDITATATVVDKYITRLSELETQGLKTNEAQEEYRALVQKINTLIPELNVSINEQTGLVNGGTAALKNNTAAWKENAVSQALQDKYSDIINQQTKAKAELQENIIKATNAETDYNEAIAEQEKAYEKIAEALGITTEALDEFDGTDWGAARLGSETVNQLITEYTALGEEVSAAQIELDTCNEAVTAGENIMAGYTDEVALAEQVLKAAANGEGAFKQSLDDAAPATEDMEARINSLVSEIQTLETQYNAAKESAYNSINQQVGLFQELDGSAKTSIDSLIETLSGQAAYMEEYAANIQKAMELGVDEGLVKKLSDGSEESAQILASIVAGGSEDIAALNDEFRKVEEGKEDFAETVAEMETDFKEKTEQLVDDLNAAVQDMNVADEMEVIGSDNIQGLINGADNKKDDLVAKYTEIALAALAAYKKVMEQASPSKKMIEAGENDIDGLIIGAESQRQNVIDTYSSLAEDAGNAVVSSLSTKFEELQTLYEETYTSAYNSINQQIGLFKELDGSAKTSINDLISTLFMQASYLDKYSDNLQKAMELGVDEGLIKELSDGSEESAQILAAIVTGGSSQIDALNKEFARVEEGKQAFSETVAGMELEFSEKTQALVTDLNSAITQMNVKAKTSVIGADNIQGMIDGAESKKAALVAKYTEIALAALAAYKRVMAQASPSKKMMEVGSNDIKGVIIGAEHEREALEKTYDSLAASALASMSKALPSSITEPTSAALTSRQTAEIVSAIKEKSGRSGDTYVSITSPEPMSERAAAREFKKAQRDISLGIA